MTLAKYNIFYIFSTSQLCTITAAIRTNYKIATIDIIIKTLLSFGKRVIIFQFLLTINNNCPNIQPRSDQGKCFLNMYNCIS